MKCCQLIFLNWFEYFICIILIFIYIIHFNQWIFSCMLLRLCIVIAFIYLLKCLNLAHQMLIFNIIILFLLKNLRFQRIFQIIKRLFDLLIIKWSFVWNSLYTNRMNFFEIYNSSRDYYFRLRIYLIIIWICSNVLVHVLGTHHLWWLHIAWIRKEWTNRLYMLNILIIQAIIRS
jgi:hypothetical protein